MRCRLDDLLEDNDRGVTAQNLVLAAQWSILRLTFEFCGSKLAAVATVQHSLHISGFKIYCRHHTVCSGDHTPGGHHVSLIALKHTKHTTHKEKDGM